MPEEKFYQMIFGSIPELTQTGLVGDYSNLLSSLVVPRSFHKMLLESDNQKEIDYLNSKIVPLSKISDLPLFEQRYPKVKNNRYLYTSKSFDSINKLNNLVIQFNNRPENYSLADLEKTIYDFEMTIYGYIRDEN